MGARYIGDVGAPGFPIPSVEVPPRLLKDITEGGRKAKDAIARAHAPQLSDVTKKENPHKIRHFYVG